MTVTPTLRPRPPFVVKVARDILPSGDVCYSARILIGAQRVGVFGRKPYMAPARLPGVPVGDGGEILISTFDSPDALASALEEAAAELRDLA